jgi:hypothetical protein
MLTFGPLSRDTRSKKPLRPSGKKKCKNCVIFSNIFLGDSLCSKTPLFLGKFCQSLVQTRWNLGSMVGVWQASRNACASCVKRDVGVGRRRDVNRRRRCTLHALESKCALAFRPLPALICSCIGTCNLHKILHRGHPLRAAMSRSHEKPI